MNSQKLKEVFEAWIHDQIHSWKDDYQAWDCYIGDEISEEEFEYICKNLVVDSINIRDVKESR